MGESRRACWSGADAVGKAPSGGPRDLVIGFGPLGVSYDRNNNVLVDIIGITFVDDHVRSSASL